MKTEYKLLFVIFFILLLSVSVVSTSMKRITQEELEQQKKEIKPLLSLFLWFLFIIGGIILGNWIYHIKEKGSFKYIVHGILGLFTGIMHIFLSFFISLFIFLLLLAIGTLGAYIPIFIYGLFILLLIGGCALELIFYKKTKKLFWMYALIFSILLIVYIIIFHTYSPSYFRGLFY